MTQDLADTISLEDLGKQWLTQPPSPAIKRALIKRVASIARTLHSHGMCHRDLYLCHFLLHQNQPDLRVSLIDLHRAFSSPRLRRRWLIKDIGSLYYSCLHLNLTQRDLLRFIRTYEPRGLRHAFGSNADFWNAVSTKANSLYKRHGDAA